MAVMIQGVLWVWDMGFLDQLGLGVLGANRLAPTLVGAHDAAFGGSPVLTVACGGAHTLAVTEEGAV